MFRSSPFNTRYFYDSVNRDKGFTMEADKKIQDQGDTK